MHQLLHEEYGQMSNSNSLQYNLLEMRNLPVAAKIILNFVWVVGIFGLILNAIVFKTLIRNRRSIKQINGRCLISMCVFDSCQFL